MLALLALFACHDPPAPASVPEPPPYTLVVHGGAGGAPSDPEIRAAMIAGLERALAHGCARLEEGGAALDTVEAVVALLEDDPGFNAGRGAVLTAEGRHELDASIMDGRDRSTGAVGGVTTVRHPIRAARAVMEHSPHVLLFGEGAEHFAAEQGLERVDNAYFTTERRTEQLKQRLAEEGGGTVGAVARDREGHLAAATSTGGLTAKRWGRIGDSPIVGAGTWADDRTVAVSGTGKGEEYIRNAVAHTVATRVGLLGESAQQAVDHVMNEVLEPGMGGLIAVDHLGRPAMGFNTSAMFRGACGPDGKVTVLVDPDAED